VTQCENEDGRCSKEVGVRFEKIFRSLTKIETAVLSMSLENASIKSEMVYQREVKDELLKRVAEVSGVTKEVSSLLKQHVRNDDTSFSELRKGLSTINNEKIPRIYDKIDSRTLLVSVGLGALTALLRYHRAIVSFFQ